MSIRRFLATTLAGAAAVAALLTAAAPAGAAPAAGTTAAPAAVAGTEAVTPAATCYYTVIGSPVAVRWSPYVGAAIYTYKHHGDRVSGPCGVTYWNADEGRLWIALTTSGGSRVWIASEWVR
ncbi:MAG TPA: hypothetical protein VGD67_04425 [Pseudonocardiaceae bacterium]